MVARHTRQGSQGRSQIPVLVKGVLAIVGLLLASYPGHSLAKTRTKAKGPAHRERHVCAESYNKAKERLRSGSLLEGKELLATCARAVCGRFLVRECTTLYVQMDVDIPSVVPIVLGAGRSPGAAFEVKMDGEPLTSKLDGVAIPVNPGWHEFTFSTENRVFATEKILLGQGQRNHDIAVSLRPSDSNTTVASQSIPTTKAPHLKQVALDDVDSESERLEPRAFKRKAVVGQPEAGPSWAAYALGGIGLVGLGGAGLFTYWGRQDNSALQSSCVPDCKPSSVHHIRMMYLAADISGATGVAALIGSAWLFFRSKSTQEKSSNQLARLRMLDVRPTASGTFATVGGTF